MRAIRFNTAFKVVQNIKVFMNLECGFTRGAVPDHGQRARDQSQNNHGQQVQDQAENLRTAKKRIANQRRMLREKDREIFRLRELSAMDEPADGDQEERSTFPSSGKPATGVLPDFLIIGAQKAGTTSLYHILVDHTHIAPAFKKELHYFDSSKFAKGAEWYRSNFPQPSSREGQRIITGEASPYYLYHPLAANRAAQLLPQAKLIALLRNPVDRAYSDYRHRFSDGVETLSFEEAIEAEEERIGGERERMIADEGYFSTSHRRYSYLARGVYVDQLRAWREHFEEDQLLVMKSEDFFARPQEFLKDVLDFLELPVWDRKEFGRGRNRRSYDPMSPAVRERLESYFEPHNQRLYEYLGQDFGW